MNIPMMIYIKTVYLNKLENQSTSFELIIIKTFKLSPTYYNTSLKHY